MFLQITSLFFIQSPFYGIEEALIAKYVCIIKIFVMKPGILSLLQYVIFFWAVFLLTPSQMVRQYEESNEYDKKNQLKTEKIDQVTLARENTKDILHGELLFKILIIPFVINKNGLKELGRFYLCIYYIIFFLQLRLSIPLIIRFFYFFIHY